MGNFGSSPKQSVQNDATSRIASDGSNEPGDRIVPSRLMLCRTETYATLCASQIPSRNCRDLSAPATRPVVEPGQVVRPGPPPQSTLTASRQSGGRGGNTLENPHFSPAAGRPFGKACKKSVISARSSPPSLRESNLDLPRDYSYGESRSAVTATRSVRLRHAPNGLYAFSLDSLSAGGRRAPLRGKQIARDEHEWQRTPANP